MENNLGSGQENLKYIGQGLKKLYLLKELTFDISGNSLA